MKTTHSYRCELCKEEFPFENIKYASDGKKIVCVGCYNKKSQKKKEEKQQIENAPELIRLICVDCRYKFSFKKGSKLKLMCPYCGKNRLMKDDVTAEKLIEEASQNSYRQQQHN